MMKRLFPLLASALLLAPPASALKMSIWDREMQTTLGAGESNGNRFNVQLIKNFSGPVIVIFSQSDEERRNSTYAGLQNRYDGVLKNGQLTLMPETTHKDKADKPENRPATPQAGTTPALTTAARSVGLTLTRLLQQFKLTVTVQTTGQNTPPTDVAPNPPGVGTSASGTNSTPFRSLDLKFK